MKKIVAGLLLLTIVLSVGMLYLTRKGIDDYKSEFSTTYQSGNEIYIESFNSYLNKRKKEIEEKKANELGKGGIESVDEDLNNKKTVALGYKSLKSSGLSGNIDEVENEKIKIVKDFNEVGLEEFLGE